MWIIVVAHAGYYSLALKERTSLGGFRYPTNRKIVGSVRASVLLKVANVAANLSPNPPKDTDGRREESGGGVRELQGK